MRSAPSKYVPIYFYRPGHQLFHASMSLADEPGALARVLNALPRPAINLLHSSSDGGHDGRAVVHLYAEVNGGSSLEDVGTLLRRVPGVTDAHVEGGTDGFLIDTSYPLRIAGGPKAMVLARQLVTHMVDQVREQLGSGGAVFLYNEGVSLGRASGQALKKVVGPNFTPTHPGQLGPWLSARGMGQIEVAELEAGRGVAVLRVTDSFECAEHTAPAPYSDFLRGLIAGFVSALWDAPVSCREVHCVALGGPFCEFRIERDTPGPGKEVSPVPEPGSEDSRR